MSDLERKQMLERESAVVSHLNRLVGRVNSDSSELLVKLDRIESAGQIKERDVILMVMKSGEIVPGRAKLIIRSGQQTEEIVYRLRKNYYFITSMVLDGTSNVRACYVVRPN